LYTRNIYIDVSGDFGTSCLIGRHVHGELNEQWLVILLTSIWTQNTYKAI